MKKHILLLLCCYTTTYSQKKDLNIKKFAFNQCLILNYTKIDSTFYSDTNDASTVQFSVNGNFDEDNELKESINNYTVLKTSNYYSKKNNLHFESGDKNIIFCNCFNFYESVELDKFIKKLLKR
ncbi:hypothetical protein [Pseudomonas shirazensis]